MITTHVFRLPCHSKSSTGGGGRGSRAVIPGMCAFNGSCNRPRAEHVTVDAFRATRRTAR